MPVNMPRVRKPWATVCPNGPLLAASGSTWIHCLSPVASANRFTSSWVTSLQELTPKGLPARSLRSPISTIWGGTADSGTISDPFLGIFSHEKFS